MQNKHLITCISPLMVFIWASCAAPEKEKDYVAEVKKEHPGKQLFNQACAPCHAPNKQLTGPPFQRIREFAGLQWAITWVNHSSELIKRKEPYAHYLFMRYDKIRHTDFPVLQDSAIIAVFDYVDSFPFDSAQYAHRKSAPSVGKAILDSIFVKNSRNVK